MASIQCTLSVCCVRGGVILLCTHVLCFYLDLVILTAVCDKRHEGVSVHLYIIPAPFYFPRTCFVAAAWARVIG